MERSRVIAAALIAVLTVTSVHSLTLPSAFRKGAIDEAYVEPIHPTPTDPVALHISVQDHLLLDRVDVRQIGTTFTVRVYWQEPAAGNTTSGPTDEQIALGTLGEGRYRVLIQSYCANRLAGTAHVSFEVRSESAPGSNGTIDDVSVTPEAPVAGERVTVHLSGHWPTAGYVRHIGMTRLSGRSITLDLYWNSPHGPVAQVITPYEYETPVRLYIPGTYTVKARVYLDRRLVDSAQTTFEVDWP